ncbi:MAG: thiamine pyrophosphate-binding protein [Spirochaetia bacterium]
MEKKTHARIIFEKDGPIEVEHLGLLTNSRGEVVDTDDSTTLCRCGGSKTKPFCDRSHEASGFTSAKGESLVPDEKIPYVGAHITIHDNRGICSHAGFCSSLLPLVFHGGEPWISPDAETMKKIREVIELCPSGALSYTVNGRETKDLPNEEEILISKNGPYYVHGGIEAVDADLGKAIDLGDDASGEHYALCRCGDSCNKPRCDGMHWYSDFLDDEALTISAANRKREVLEPEWVRAAQVDDFASTDRIVLRIEGRTVVLTNTDNELGAIEGICPHQGGPLYDSDPEGRLIRCPWHGHAFDRITGKAVGEDRDLEAFETEVRESAIYVRIAAAQRSEWTVSHVMVETMVNWGITTVFGMVGHSNLGLAEAVRVQEGRQRLRYIGIRHEGAAAFAASGYAKASGRPAACLTIAGPGATNLLTGLWDAKVDRAPVLALTGQVRTQFFGPGAFQEIDLPAAFSAVADFSQTVLPSSKHGELMSLAIKHAIVNRDVAHLIFPDEVQTLDAGTQGPGGPDGRIGATPIVPPAGSLTEATLRINTAKRPAIVVGFGARESMNEITTFAEALSAPVLTTFKAKGQIGDSHPLGCGVLGRSGTPVASTLMGEADLLIVFGASFSEHTGIDPSKPIIQVDFDPMALGKFHRVSTPVWGDCAVTASLFSEAVSPNTGRRDARKQIASLWRAWREEKQRRASRNNGHGLNSAVVFEKLSHRVDADALISVDVGNNTYSYGRYFESTRQRTIMSGYLGSIGFGFPAAIGAYMAETGRQIVSVSGDGGFGQYMEEFLTAVKHRMNITHVLLNNGELGKISKEQRTGGWDVWQTGLKNPSFAEYARICGGFGVRVEDADGLDSALRDGLAYDGPAMVEIMSDPELI